jgi:hypothetical protein
MTNKSKKKVSGTAKKTTSKSLLLPKKTVIGKSAASSRASTPASRVSKASQLSRQTTVVSVNDSDDERHEASHAGSMPDVDGDRTMEPADEEDDESELGKKICFHFSLGTLTFGRTTHQGMDSSHICIFQASSDC